MYAACSVFQQSPGSSAGNTNINGMTPFWEMKLMEALWVALPLLDVLFSWLSCNRKRFVIITSHALECTLERPFIESLRGGRHLSLLTIWYENKHINLEIP